LPGPADVLLLVEIADSSLTYDRKTKARVYARAGIEDYWIVNLVDGAVEVHRDPVRGRYRSIQAYGRGEAIQPLAFPEISVAVGDILGAEV
jgi:Uma2 family endonuclease